MIITFHSQSAPQKITIKHSENKIEIFANEYLLKEDVDYTIESVAEKNITTLIGLTVSPVHMPST